MPHFIATYIALLKEAYEDLLARLEEELETETQKGFMIGLFVLTPIVSTLFFFTVLVNAAEVTAPSATINVEQVSPTTASIILKNDATPLNAVEVELFFDPSVVQVADLTIMPVLCEERFVITKIIDNAAGTIFYQCGTITPFAGTSTVLANLTFVPLSAGTSSLTFGSSTNALAHDGLGTNVTKERVSGTMTVAL